MKNRIVEVSSTGDAINITKSGIAHYNILPKLLNRVIDAVETSAPHFLKAMECVQTSF
jgi:hypothetical protein